MPEDPNEPGNDDLPEGPTESGNDDLYKRWVQDIMHHSKEAWADLVAAFGTRLRKDIRVSSNKNRLSAEWAEDVEQETWRRALQGIKKFVWKNEETFYHWLRCISLLVIYEFSRSNNRTASIEDTTEEGSDVDLDRLYVKYGINDASVEDQVILHRRMADIERALMSLKEEEREIFLRWALGERPRVLAVIYNKRPGTISQLVRRAIKKIRQKYNQSANSEDSDDE